MSTPLLSPEARQILEATRELIREPEHWTKYENARTKPGGPGVRIESPDATCWCLNGAVEKACLDLGVRRSVDRQVRQALQDAGKQLFRVPYVFVNDHLGHAAVMRLLAVALGEPDAEASS